MDDRTTETDGGAFAEGKRAGLSMAALAASIVSFLSLLGLEKAILAATLAVLALRGAGPGSRPRRLSLVAIALVSAYVVAFAVLVALFHPKLVELLRLLHQLG